MASRDHGRLGLVHPRLGRFGLERRARLLSVLRDRAPRVGCPYLEPLAHVRVDLRVVEEVEVGQRAERAAAVEVEALADRVLSVCPRARLANQQVADRATDGMRSLAGH